VSDPLSDNLLIELLETGDGGLRLLLSGTEPVESETPPPVPDAYKMEPTDNCPLWEIEWPETVSYQVQWESYVNFQPDFKYEVEGILLRHLRSRFLDRLKEDLWLTDAYLEDQGQKIMAWTIMTWWQVIDVAAMKPPTVRLHPYSALPSLRRIQHRA
jgi:hypothetical protein